MLISGSYDKTIKVWDHSIGQAITTHVGHLEAVLCVIFHPTGRMFASGGLDKTIKIWQRQPESLETATNLRDLGFRHENLGKDTEAELLYTRALSIQEHLLGVDSPNIDENVGNLARLYKIQAKYSEAETLYLRLLSIREQQAEVEPRVPAEMALTHCLIDLADLYERLRRYAEAELLYQRALASWEQWETIHASM